MEQEFTQLKELRSLAARLRLTGDVKLTKSSDSNTGMRSTTLTYTTAGEVAAFWPITGAVNLNFTFSESLNKWDCGGSMFGVAPRSDNPRAWFMTAYQGLRTREMVMHDFLQRAAAFWERYRGDLEQFCFRLGVDQAAVGQMVRLENGFAWSTHADPGTKVWFSKPVVEPGFGESLVYKFGFYEDVITHMWELSVPNLMKIREELTHYAHQSKDYCYELASCFG